ncbi:MAG TPA: isopentenyl-diphosphate Delta-isomerase [Flavisolibacter sp.]|nr:isopentenyl-diphosphate Delta-isomerase [Flavisolibacter sp.]
MITQEVILVNEKDEEVGTMEKMEAHQKGLLHRAFSVFIFDKHGRMLLQQRARGKYHGAHLWTNACCSHPYPNEITELAAGRRLKEELGFTTKLQEIFSFLYKAEVENNLVEHEYDHVFAGEYDNEINPNATEVANIDFREMVDIKNDIEVNPGLYTSWFKIAFPRIEKWWEDNYNYVNVKPGLK